MSAVPKPECIELPEFREFIRGFPCDICVQQAKDPDDLVRRLRECGPTHAAHLPHTKAWGDPFNVVPLGFRHHTEQHKKGRDTFQALYCYEATERAAYWYQRWLREGQWQEMADAGEADTRRRD